MSSLFQNQENNWAYVFLLLVITAVAAVGMIAYTQDTIREIDSLSERPAVIGR